MPVMEKFVVKNMCPYQLNECTKREEMECGYRTDETDPVQWREKVEKSAACQYRGNEVSPAAWKGKYKLLLREDA